MQQADKKVFLAKATNFISRARIKAYNAEPDYKSTRLEGVLGDVARYARYREEDGIEYQYDLTIYGINWSIDSGRINGQTHIALKAMKVKDLLEIIYAVNAACPTIDKIPAFLMSRIAAAA